MDDVSSNPFVDAANAGLSPIPIDTSTKRPLVRWATFQETPAEHLQLIDWASENIGIVCGQVSGRLLCIDIEGAFMEGHGLGELAKRLKIAGVYNLFWSWMQGYCESTPSGGMHILVRLEGEGPLEGNTKLASDPQGKTLIETRAEGGYVIVAPSRNGVKSWQLMSGGFDQVAYATLEEWQAVAAVLASFDVSSPAPPPEQSFSTVTADRSPSILRLGDSWIDDALAQLPNIRTVLSSHGWDTDFRHDEYGEHWTRPGKDLRQGSSASISAADRLFVHSSNAGLPMGNPTLDALDVILAYELGRRPSSDERVEYLRQFRPDHPGGRAVEGRADQTAGPTDPSLYLPEDFWQSREWLIRVRSAAMRRMISPDAVLGALLSAYATTIPMGIRLPAIVGQWAPLNLYSVLVSRSGGGKTSAMGLADELLGPVSNPDIVFRSLRSGEGLINLACRKVGKDEPAAYRVGVQIAFDEGGVLSRQTERSGSTTIPYLNTAWAGHGMVGGAKASEDGFFPASLVRICAVIGVQFGAAANLFTGESQILGFPQRLTFYGLDHPELLAIRRSDSDYGPIKALGLPTWEHSEFTRAAYEMKVPESVADEVWEWTQSKHGDAGPTALDGHMMNLRLRLAAVIALASGEGGVSEADWALALCVERTSRSLRQALLASLGDVSLNRAKDAGKADATREIAKIDVFLERAAQSLATKVARSPEPLTRRQAKDHLRPFHQRKQADYREVIELALQRGWLLSTGDNRLKVGPAWRGGSGGS